MEEKLTKELAQKLMESPDKIRGIDFKTDENFILKEKGKEGLKKVEKRMEELGYPIKYKKISLVSFYPLGLRVFSLLVIKDVFGWDNKKIREMGEVAPKSSLFIKIFMRFVASIEGVKKETSRTWRRYHSTGELKLIIPGPGGEFSVLRQPGHSCKLELVNHYIHPIYCIYLEGYLQTVCEMMINTPATCREITCPFRGDKSHEFVLKW